MRSKALFRKLKKYNAGSAYSFMCFFNKKVFTSLCLESYLEHNGTKQIDYLVDDYLEFIKN